MRSSPRKKKTWGDTNSNAFAFFTYYPDLKFFPEKQLGKKDCLGGSGGKKFDGVVKNFQKHAETQKLIT